MITEDQLEQLAIQWFQDTGWNHVHGAVIAPEGVAAEREALRTLTPALSHGEKEEDGCLVEAVRISGSRQISRQSVAREVVGYRDMNRDIVSRFGGESGSRWGIATKCRDFGLVAKGAVESRQLSRHRSRLGRNKAPKMCRPFRAWNRAGDGTQGVALGCRIMPHWGGRNGREAKP